jgi:hypothetical protein
MENFSAEISSPNDLVKARLGLRNYILNDLKSSPFVIVRAVIALTALGELILAAAQEEPVMINCTVVKKQGALYLQYQCKLHSNFLESEQIARSGANFSKVMEESSLNNTNSNRTEISGLMLLKTGY